MSDRNPSDKAQREPLSTRTLSVLVALLLILGGVAAITFLSYPALDLSVASAFGSAEGFPLRFHPIPRFFNSLINVLAVLTALGLVGAGALAWRFRVPVLGLYRRQYGFLLASLVLGPGLIANLLFKEHWGRARPRHLDLFGGDKSFSPPLLISDQCQSNCSFVSGDASLAFYYLALAFVVPTRARLPVLLGGLGFGVLIGIMRIIQGAHFLSDVIFAALFVGLSLVGLYWALLQKWSPPQNPPSDLLVQLGLKGTAKADGPHGKGLLWVWFKAKPEDLGVPHTDD